MCICTHTWTQTSHIHTWTRTHSTQTRCIVIKEDTYYQPLTRMCQHQRLLCRLKNFNLHSESWFSIWDLGIHQYIDWGSESEFLVHHEPWINVNNRKVDMVLSARCLCPRNVNETDKTAATESFYLTKCKHSSWKYKKELDSGIIWVHHNKFS